MMSVNWADEAGFTKLDLGEYSNVDSDTVKEDLVLPKLDAEIISFTEDAKDAFRSKKTKLDTTVLETSGNKIDLYYVLAMTPSSGERDRYVFDGRPHLELQSTKYLKKVMPLTFSMVFQQIYPI